jgi:hypothetical protein
MARPKKSPPPQAEPTATHLSPKVLFCGVALICGVIGGLLLIYQANVLNHRLRIEKRVEQDPGLQRWMNQIRPSLGQEIDVIWLGQIAKTDRTQPSGRAPRLSSISLSPAYQLDGAATTKSSAAASLSVSVLHNEFPHGEPSKGDWWVFALGREKTTKGHTYFMRDARPVP